jgi:hypothetical protein
MKIQYCSDLHLEFPENKHFMEQHPIEVKGEVFLFLLHENQTATHLSVFK